VNTTGGGRPSSARDRARFAAPFRTVSGAARRSARGGRRPPRDDFSRLGATRSRGAWRPGRRRPPRPRCAGRRLASVGKEARQCDEGDVEFHRLTRRAVPW